MHGWPSPTVDDALYKDRDGREGWGIVRIDALNHVELNLNVIDHPDSAFEVRRRVAHRRMNGIKHPAVV